MMSTTQLYFNLLPSDLCAASNFRHAFICLGSFELILSSASAGLTLTLSIAIYTHQKFIRFHTSFHPFLQASVFLTFGIILLFKIFALLGLLLAILLNDGEIFVTCAQEEIDELMKTDDYQFYNFSKVPIVKNHQRSAFGQGLLLSDQMVPGPFSCGTDQNCLYRAATCLAVKEADHKQIKTSHPIAIELTGSEAQVPYLNPTEVARKCFRRRQACLYRLRHILAVYPILQLILGAASIAFWFSSDDIHPDQEDDEFYLSQLPSIRLFNSYLSIWAIGLIHIMIFLLISTWHYARVDWQMQVLAVHHVLNVSRQKNKSSGGEGNIVGQTSTKTTNDDQFTLEKVNRCPSCRKRERNRKEKQKERIRDSYTLRKVIKKEEKIIARQERKYEQLEKTNSNLLYLANSNNPNLVKPPPNRKTSWDDVQEHRVAALSSLLRNSSSNRNSILELDYLKTLSIQQKMPSSKEGAGGYVRRSLPPNSIPVSPTAMSIDSAEDPLEEGTRIARVMGSGDTFGKRRSTGSLPCEGGFPSHTFSLEDLDDYQNSERDDKMKGDKFFSRPCSAVIAPSFSNEEQQNEKRIKRAKVKSILQSDYRPISTRKQKHVTFPASFDIPNETEDEEEEDQTIVGIIPSSASTLSVAGGSSANTQGTFGTRDRNDSLTSSQAMIGNTQLNRPKKAARLSFIDDR